MRVLGKQFPSNIHVPITVVRCPNRECSQYLELSVSDVHLVRSDKDKKRYAFKCQQCNRVSGIAWPMIVVDPEDNSKILGFKVKVDLKNSLVWLMQ
jgi:peptide subunit release factor 1 (eRF1)